MKKFVFLDTTIEQLRRKVASPETHPLFLRLTDLCTRYKTVPLPELHPPCSTTYMGIACVNLALAYLLTEQKQYLKEARRWMMTVVNYEKWGNAHLVNVDLSASWILFGLSLAYDWLKDGLDEQDRRAVRDKIILQSDIMYTYYRETQGKGWATQYWQNHNWINLNGLAAAGYALESEHAPAKDWIAAARENFAIVYDGLSDDGSDYEGTAYWHYGVLWLFVYAHLLKCQEGKDYFKTCAFLKNTFFYRLYQSVPNLKDTANFGDCHDRKSSHCAAVYYKTAAEYQNGYAQHLGNLVNEQFLYQEYYESKIKPGILPEIAFEILWHDSSVEPEDFASLPTVKCFDDLGLMVYRSSWKEDALYLAFKSGVPGGKKQWSRLLDLYFNKKYQSMGLSHQHPDDNSFILHAHGAYLTNDDGYNRNMKAACHNIITVGGKGYPVEDTNDVLGQSFLHNLKEYPDFDPGKFGGEIDVSLENPRAALFRGNSAAVYDRSLGLKKNNRTVICNPRYVLYIDEIESDRPHIYQWRLHTDNPGRVVPDRKVLYDAGPARMELCTISSQELELKQYETYVKAVMTTQEPENYCENHLQTLELSNKIPAEKMEFVTILIPEGTFSGQEITVDRIREKNYTGMEIHYGNCRDTFLYKSGGEDLKYGSTATDAGWIWLQHENGRVINYAAGNIRKLIAGGKLLCDLPEAAVVLKELEQ